MNTITKSDLSNTLAGRLGMTRTAAALTVAALIALIEEEAAAGNAVVLSGFGKFSMRDTPERPGRNPRTGEAMMIAASRRLVFKASKSKASA